MIGRHDQHRGFSLLEVVVAFAIASISLAVLGQIFGQGARHLALSRDYTDAMTLADSLLAEYGNIKDPATRSLAESSDRFQWTVAVQPYSSPESAQDETPAAAGAVTARLRLMQIDVAVEWHRYGKSRAISVSSLRVVPNESNAPRPRQTL